MVGLVLEARLRSASGGKLGLDALLRAAYAKWSGARGFTPEQFEALAAELAGSDQRVFFDRALRSTDELDYGEALACFGLRFAEAAEGDGRGGRWKLEVDPASSVQAKGRLDALLAPSPALTARK